MGVQERLTLEDATAPTLIACEHRHRYRVAASLLGGARVLDLCCGSGYGSRLLSQSASTVHGVDNDAATIDAAAAAASDVSAITYEVADALEFLLRADVAERFDAIVCFEGLEHLPRIDATLERLRELATNGVRMVLSVPNSKGLEEVNEYHVTDFDFDDALERIGSFPDATVLTQCLAEGSIISVAECVSDELEAHAVLDRRDGPDYANHFLVCVGLTASALPNLAMQLEAAPLANGYMRGLERANTELRRTNQRLTRERLGKADSAAGAFVAKQEAAAARLAELEQQYLDLLREHEAWIDRCHGAEERETRLQAQLALLEERLAPLAVRAMAKVTSSERRG